MQDSRARAEDAETEDPRLGGVVRTVPTSPARRTPVAKADARSEKKIDRLEDRLEGIEQALLSLAAKMDRSVQAVPDAQPGQANPPPPLNLVDRRRRRGPAPHAPPAAAPYEGTTGLTTQSDEARMLLLHTVNETPSVRHDARIRAALRALEELASQRDPENDAVPTPATLIDRSPAETDGNGAPAPQPPWAVVKVAVDKALSLPPPTS